MFAILLSAALTAPAPFDPQARVTEAIEQVRPFAFSADKVDWDAIEREMRAIASKAEDTADLLPAYGVLMLRLRDGHSTLIPPPEVAKLYRDRYGDRRLVPDIPPRARVDSTFPDRKEPAARVLKLGGKTAVLLEVPGVEWAEGNDSAPYGNRLWQLVAEAEPAACGFVVDVRGNLGGDVWPMVTGLSPLIGDGYRFRSVDRSGVTSDMARLDGAAALALDGNEQIVINRIDGWRPLPSASSMPVAVLFDQSTASSGEGVVLAFRGSATSRSFGHRTRGLASANDMFELKDGIRLFVTTTMVIDRTGQSHPDGIAPDEQVDAGPGATEDPDDAVVERAKAWLSQQTSCRA